MPKISKSIKTDKLASLGSNKAENKRSIGKAKSEEKRIKKTIDRKASKNISETKQKNNDSGKVDGNEIAKGPPMEGLHRRYNWMRALGRVSIILFFVGGIFFTWPIWFSYLEPYISVFSFRSALHSDLSTLTLRIAALENRIEVATTEKKSISQMETDRLKLRKSIQKIFKRLESVEAALENAKIMSAKVSVTMSRDEAQSIFDGLAGRLALLEKNNENSDDFVARLRRLESFGFNELAKKISRVEEKKLQLGSEINEMRARPNQAEGGKKDKTLEAPKGVDLKDTSTLVLAVNQLRKAVLSGGPFAIELKRFRTILKEEDGIKAPLLELENYSKRGVMTHSILSQEFTDLSGKIVMVADPAENSDILPQQIFRKLSSLISLRRIDGKAEASSIDAYLLKVENSLKDGNLGDARVMAAKIVQDFPSTSPLMRPWIYSVSTRILAERAVASLHVYAVTLIAKSG